MTESRAVYSVPRSKYGNQKVALDGHTFDSRAEARRYQELHLLLAAGEITDLVVHPRFALYAPLLGEDILVDQERAPATLRLCWTEPGHDHCYALRVGYWSDEEHDHCVARRVGYWSGDFAYNRKDGSAVVEDVKQPATRTAVYRLKKKMVEATYGLQVTEIMP